jgi:hypothetical protein
MWTMMRLKPDARAAAEKCGVFHSVPHMELTAGDRQYCYTFQRLASSTSVIRNAYYHHNKQQRYGLKEEARWS